MPTVHASNPMDIPREMRQEGFLHFIAREGRVTLRWVIGLSLIATIICMMSFFMFAMIPAVIMLGAYILLVLADEVERRSDTVAHASLERSEVALTSDVLDDHAEDNQLRPVDAAIVRRESKTGIAIVAAITVAAVLIAGIMLPMKVVAIGALVVFAYMLLLAAPLWLGWFNDDIETQQAEPPQQTGESATT